jgi:hypothetical protein
LKLSSIDIVYIFHWIIYLHGILLQKFCLLKYMKKKKEGSRMRVIILDRQFFYPIKSFQIFLIFYFIFQMYSNWIIIIFLFIITIHLTYEQESSAYEVREFSLSRPYASGRLKMTCQYSIWIENSFSFFNIEFPLASNW